MSVECGAASTDWLAPYAGSVVYYKVYARVFIVWFDDCVWYPSFHLLLQNRTQLAVAVAVATATSANSLSASQPATTLMLCCTHWEIRMTHDDDYNNNSNHEWTRRNERGVVIIITIKSTHFCQSTTTTTTTMMMTTTTHKERARASSACADVDWDSVPASMCVHGRQAGEQAGILQTFWLLIWTTTLNTIIWSPTAGLNGLKEFVSSGYQEFVDNVWSVVFLF